MKKRRKLNLFFGIVVIILALACGLKLWKWNQAEKNRDNLEIRFKKIMLEKSKKVDWWEGEDFSQILTVEYGDLVAYADYDEENSRARHVVFKKSMFAADGWKIAGYGWSKGTAGVGGVNGEIRDSRWGAFSISKNTRRVEKVIIKTKYKKVEFQMNPDEPMLLLLDTKIDGKIKEMWYCLENGEKLSRDEFWGLGVKMPESKEELETVISE